MEACLYLNLNLNFYSKKKVKKQSFQHLILSTVLKVLLSANVLKKIKVNIIKLLKFCVNNEYCII